MFTHVWKVADPTVPPADLIREATAQLDTIRPRYYRIVRPLWTVTADRLILTAQLESYPHSAPVHPRLPAEPLLKILPDFTKRQHNETYDSHGWHVTDAQKAAILRARKEGTVTHRTADALCCELLRMHPAEIYGDDWFDFEETA